MVEPVLPITWRTALLSWARQEKSDGANGLRKSIFASAGKIWPATPLKGRSAPFKLMRADGAMVLRSAIPHKIAAPAECPDASRGLVPIAPSSAAIASAMAGKVKRNDDGARVKP